MKKSFQFFVFPLTLLLCFSFGCQQAAEREEHGVNIEADVDSIKALFAPFSTIIASGDLEGWLNLFTEDVVFMAPNSLVSEGKDAIRGRAKRHFDQFDMEETISIEEIEVSGDLAFMRYSYTFQITPKTGGETDHASGKALAILKRQANGSWKCSHYIYNLNHRQRRNY